ncbi:MAG: MarR family transcriptional regulator [Candidatus Dormiibacterota bacterium]
MEAWKSFLRAHAVITRALERQLLETHRLPLAEYDVLVQLNEAEGRALRMSQLADRVLLSRSGLTRLVERLERNGLVERSNCSSDARGSFAVLTELGVQRLREAAPAHLESVRALFAEPLTTEQVDSLREALQLLAAAVPAGCAAALPDGEIAAVGADPGDCVE